MPSTIQNCWSRSQAIDFGARPIGNNLWSDSRALLESIQIDIQALQDQGRIRQAMNIHQFIDPEEERIEEFVDEILDSIVARHGVEREAESDEEIEESVPIISHSVALQAIQTLRSYEEQNGESGPDFGRVLRAQERAYLVRRSKGMAQGNLGNWLTKEN